MDRTSVTSRSIASVGYEADTMTLEIEFSNGRVYDYFDVPYTAYQELLGAPSMGAYLNQNIKLNYRCARV